MSDVPAIDQPRFTVFTHEVVVRPSDVDFARHLNHVSIVGFFEYGRVRAHHDVRLARPGFPDMNTVVRSLTVDYLGQASTFDAMTVRTWVRRDGTTSRTWSQELIRPDGGVVARAEVVSVLLDAATGRPTTLPAMYRDLFAAYREHAS